LRPDYIAQQTLGFDRLEEEVLPRFPPMRVADITGLSVEAIEQFAALYGAASRSFIRLGEGMTRLARGGEALRAVALLPGVTGAYGRRGGGALLLAAASCELNYAALRRPSGGETVAPPVAPEPPTPRPSRNEAPAPAPAPAPSASPKTSFENLEDEMASLLGRPKPSS